MSSSSSLANVYKFGDAYARVAVNGAITLTLYSDFEDLKGDAYDISVVFGSVDSFGKQIAALLSHVNDSTRTSK